MTALVSYTETVCNNTPNLVYSAKCLANSNANGSLFSVQCGGFVSPGGSVNLNVNPSVTLNVYIGPLGTSGDPLLISTVIPAFEIQQNSDGVPLGGPAGNFSYQCLVAMRANAGATTTNANGVFSAFVLNPFAVHSNPGANGNVSSTWSGGGAGGNTANISIYASTTGQNTNAIFEVVTISAVA
jgi:hypothetical protein